LSRPCGGVSTGRLLPPLSRKASTATGQEPRRQNLPNRDRLTPQERTGKRGRLPPRRLGLSARAERRSALARGAPATTSSTSTSGPAAPAAPGRACMRCSKACWRTARGAKIRQTPHETAPVIDLPFCVTARPHTSDGAARETTLIIGLGRIGQVTLRPLQEKDKWRKHVTSRTGSNPTTRPLSVLRKWELLALDANRRECGSLLWPRSRRS
jgi:hypothetical protein